MAHLYEVQLSNGDRPTVETPNHHDDHPADAFARHLLDVLKGAAGGVISATIIRYTYKGRR